MSGLPRGWVQVPLGKFAAKTKNVDPSKSPAEVFELYSVPSFSTGSPERVSGSEIKSSKQAVQSGDVLLCKIVPHINRVWTVKRQGQHRKIASGEWIVYRNHGCEPHYLRYCLSEESFREQFLSTVAGVGGSLMRARPSEVAKIGIPIPPLPEQRQIVAKLISLTSRTARARGELGIFPRLVQKYREAILATEFDNDVATAWEGGSVEQRIGEGLVGLVRAKSEQSSTSGSPYIRMNHYDLNGRWNSDDLTYVSITASEFERYSLQRDDVLFNTRNSVELVGKVAIWKGEPNQFVYNNNLLRLRFRKGIVADFAAFYMMSPTFRRFLEAAKSATTSVAAIYQRSLYSAPFPLPSVTVQQEIVRRIETAFAWLDRVTAEHANASRLLPKLDQAILAKAFRGELVPPDHQPRPLADAES